ncbi:MAG: hypothetical protein IPL23_30650 [Saprospiraceae bacterium]|nr:hypothetical protein [Saprospiraceae bacterium]
MCFIQDIIPTGLTNITGITGGATLSGTTITWNVGTLAPGQNKTMTYMATVLPPNTTRSYRNVAQVTAQTEKTLTVIQQVYYQVRHRLKTTRIQ